MVTYNLCSAKYKKLDVILGNDIINVQHFSSFFLIEVYYVFSKWLMLFSLEFFNKHKIKIM